MAQTNYTPISLYYSTTASAVPTAANLVPGELAINTNDGKLYYEDSSGVVQVLASKATSSGTFTTISVSGVATFSAGTVALPAITTTGDTNTGIFFPAADTIAFTEGGAESMRIDSSGNLGLGVTPSAWQSGSKGFQVLKGGLWHDNSQYFALVNNAYYDGTNWKYISSAASSQIVQILGESRFYNAASGTAGNNVTYTQAMTLDASGNLGVGTTSPSSRLHLTATASTIGQSRIEGSGVGTLFAGMTAGAIGFLHSNTGTLAFGTSTSDNNLVERARINSSGSFFIGCTSAPSASVFGTAFIYDGTNGYWNNSGSSTGATTHWQFINPNGVVGTISTSGSVTSYNITSDQRLKTNIVNAPSGNINDIKVRSFDWIADGSHQEYGMVAQELIEVAPYAVTKFKNPDDMMQVDYSKLVPMMIKEIQDLKQRIATLENK